MAIAFVNSFFSGGSTSGTSATVGPKALTAGNLLVLIVACKSTALTVSTITDTAGNTFTSCGANSVSTANFRTEVFYVPNARANASNTVTVTMSGTVTDLNLAILQYSGAATTSPFDVAVTSTGSGTALTSGSFTPSTTNEVGVAFGIQTNAVTGDTAGTNYTLRDSGLGTATCFLGGEDRLLLPAGAQTATMTANASATWQMVVAVFSPTSIVSGITPEDFEQHTLGRSPLRWNPERSASTWGITPAIATVPPPSGPFKTTVLPELFMRPKWDPERTWITRAGWTQALWAIAPTKIPEPVLPERLLTQWNPERSLTKRPASVQATWAVPPTKIPEPLLAERVTRPAWEPERTQSVGIPYLPPTWPTTVMQPERNLRPPWNPERSDNARAGWTQALWAIAPTRPPDGVSPERLLTPWRPQDQQPVWNPFQFAAVLVPDWGYESLGTQNVAIGWTPPHGDLFISGFRAQVPVFGYEVYGPQRLLLNWKPERSELTRAGWIQSLWAIPPADWEPLLPDQPYPLIAPDRSMLCVPIQVTAAPSSTVYAIFVFDD
jgi:hypothetical protein